MRNTGGYDRPGRNLYYWGPERNNMQPPPAPRRPLSKGGVGGSPRMGARGSAIPDPRADLGVDHQPPTL